MGFTSFLVEEGAKIIRNQEVTRDEEVDWLRYKLADRVKIKSFDWYPKLMSQ